MLQDLAVQDTQLFDLRGATDAVRQATQIRDLLVTYSGKAYHRTAVVFQNGHMSPQNELIGMSLWVYDKEAGISPVSDNQVTEEDERVSLLCLIDMPETPEQLDALLKAFPNEIGRAHV